MTLSTENNSRSSNAGLVLGQRQRRWPNTKPALAPYGVRLHDGWDVDSLKLDPGVSFHNVKASINYGDRDGLF